MINKNWLANFYAEANAKAVEGKTYLLDLIPQLKAQGISKLSVHYDGSGDSGDFDEYQAQDATGQQLVFAGGDKEKIGDAFYHILEAKRGGWEINEGSYGDITLDVSNSKITIEHNQRIEDVGYSELEV